MNNLSQTREEAKQLYLKRQRSKVIDQLKGASLEEKKATIRHIDGFLESTTPEGKIFWLKVRREVETQIERETAKSRRENEKATDNRLSFPQTFNPNSFRRNAR